MIGATIGGYRLDRKLGEGGMGDVYVGVHALIGKRVAVKVLREEHSRNLDLINRFFKEARATAMLQHPGTVDIIDTGRLPDGRGFIIMTLLEGESLKDRLARERLAPVVQMAVARQIADVLATAHSKGIIHRDLKPENVFLLQDDAAPSRVRVKVLDFGVAKLTDNSGQAATNPNALIGTPQYMAPEQCKGAAYVDTQSDIYALGCIMYEMACGRPPFVCRGFGDYLMAHLTQTPAAPSSLATLDPRLERIIVKALAKEKSARQRSMSDVMSELDALTPGGSHASAATVMAQATLLAPRGSHEMETVKGLNVPPELLVKPQSPAHLRAQPQAQPQPQPHAQSQMNRPQPIASSPSQKNRLTPPKKSNTLLWVAMGAVAAAIAGAVTWLVMH
jgi:serine/threonine-protein kinase